MPFDIQEKVQLYFKVYKLSRLFCFLRIQNSFNSISLFPFVNSKKFNSFLMCTDCADCFSLCDFKKAQLYFEVYRLYKPFCLCDLKKNQIYLEVYILYSRILQVTILRANFGRINYRTYLLQRFDNNIDHLLLYFSCKFSLTIYNFSNKIADCCSIRLATLPQKNCKIW